MVEAVRQAGPQGNLSDADYDRKLINQLYDTRSAYVDRIGFPDLKTRYATERSNVLKELENQAPRSIGPRRACASPSGRR